MKIVKGVFTYILILLGILLAAGILLFTSMAFLKFEVFGLNVIMHNDKYDWSSVIGPDTWTGEIKNVYINSNGYDVVVRPWTEKVHEGNDFAAVYVTDNGFGLSTNGVKNAILKVSYKDNYEDVDFITTKDEQKDANTIIFDLSTPEGLISYKNSKIEVVLPWSSGFNYNLHITSGKGDINIIPATNPDNALEELGNLPLNSLYLTTDKGNVTVRGLAEEDEKVVLEELILKTNTGKFDLSDQNIESTGKVKINSKRGDFTFKNIEGEFIIKGDNLVLDARDIITNNKQFSYNCPNGTIKMDTLDVGTSVAFIVTEYAKIEIGLVKGDTSIEATYGDTHIANTSSNVVDVTTTNGNITIGKAWTSNCKWNDNRTEVESDTGSVSGTLALRSTYGDITVNEYNGDAWVTNKRGKINISQSESFATDVKTRIETDRGHVEAKKLHGEVTAVATGSANMSLSFYGLKKSYTGTAIVSNITIGSGSLDIKVPTVSTDTADFAVYADIKEGGKLDKKSAGSLDASHNAGTAKWIKGAAAGSDGATVDSAFKYQFKVTVNGGYASFDEPAVQYN